MTYQLISKLETTGLIRSFLTTIFCVFLLYGCSAQHTGWRPTVDTYGDPRAEYLYQDERECQALAGNASGSTPGETAKGAGGGALIGAASGAIIGAIVGNAGIGAAIGAASGALGGGAYKGVNSNEQYKRAFNNCMRRRGHNVIN